MGIASYSGASSVIKPGVVTTATRPSSPFVGQLIYDTTTTTTLAWNGTAWVGTSGLTMLKAETAFASNTAAVDNIFSSAYTFYRMMINYQASASEVLMRFRVGGVAATTNYFYQLTENYSTTFAGIRTSSSSSVSIGRTTGGAFTNFAIVDLYGPALATPTRYQSVLLGHPNASYDAANDFYGGAHSTATAYDGFDINVSSGTLTGSYTIYGYAK
jgi:hypothetical protein